MQAEVTALSSARAALAIERESLQSEKQLLISAHDAKIKEVDGHLIAAQEERDQLSSMNNDQKQRIDALVFELQEATNRVAAVTSDFNSVKADADALRLQIINDATRRYMCVCVCVCVCVSTSCVEGTCVCVYVRVYILCSRSVFVICFLFAVLLFVVTTVMRIVRGVLLSCNPKSVYCRMRVLLWRLSEIHYRARSSC